MKDEEDVAAAVHRYISTGRKYFASDKEVAASLSTVPFYLNGRSNQRKLVLQWIEESYESREPVDPAQLTIEHVMPRTPTEAWREELAPELSEEESFEEGGSTGGLRGSKGSVFEGGIRVPCIVSWPSELPTGEVSDFVGLMMDVVPTVLHAADGVAPTLPDADGISLLDALRDGTGPAERPVSWSYQGQQAARRGRYKLVIAPHEGMDPPGVLNRALFDLEADPAESVNIAGRETEGFAALERDLAAYRVVGGTAGGAAALIAPGGVVSGPTGPDQPSFSIHTRRSGRRSVMSSGSFS